MSDIHRSIVGCEVTLNGKPATILGRRHDFAVVATLDGSQAFQWAWPTAYRIYMNGGEFHS